MDNDGKLNAVIDCLQYAVNCLYQNQLMAQDNAKEVLDLLQGLKTQNTEAE